MFEGVALLGSLDRHQWCGGGEGFGRWDVHGTRRRGLAHARPARVTRTPQGRDPDKTGRRNSDCSDDGEQID